jgi:hypothetical protein
MRREADHLPHYRSEIKNVWNYTSTAPYIRGLCLNNNKLNFTYLPCKINLKTPRQELLTAGQYHELALVPDRLTINLG